MTSKPVIPRLSARRDIEEAFDHYVASAGERVAQGFVDALEIAFRSMGQRPQSGSPRYAHDLSLPSLRSLMLKRYPYIAFYLERKDHIDVWRVLHGARDIPSRMRGDSPARPKLRRASPPPGSRGED